MIAARTDDGRFGPFRFAAGSGPGVWSGIHFRTADEQGERIGAQVARWRERHYFGPDKRR